MDDKLLQAVRIGAGTAPAGRRQDGVTYSVVQPVAATTPGEKRRDARRRTRLRSGKILDSANRFLVECLIFDVSTRGARLRPAKSIPLPDAIRLYRDEEKTVAAAAVAWRRGGEFGIEFDVSGEAVQLTPTERHVLESRYYGLGAP